LPHSSSLSACPPTHLTYASPTVFAPFPTTNQIPVTPKIQSVSKAIQAELPNISNGIENSFSKINIQSNNSSNRKQINDVSDGLSANTKNLQTRKDPSQSANTSYDKSTKRGSFYDNLDPLLSLESAILSEFKSNPSDKKQSDKKSPPQQRSQQNSLEKKKVIDGNSLSKIVNSIKPHSTHGKSTNDSNSSSNNCNTLETKQ